MSFNCIVVTPEEQVFDETVNQVIFPAFDGQMGILTDRAPLLAKIGVGELKLTLQNSQTKSFFIDGGIAQMKDNKLTILTTTAQKLEELSAEEGTAELAEATARKISDEKSFNDRQHSLDRARAIQQLARK